MTITLNANRRALIKGAAWSAPVILASATIPAYAASQQEPVVYYAQSQHIDTYYNSDTGTYYTDITTRYPEGIEQPGFSVGYEEGKSEDTVATLQRLDYYIAIPRTLDRYGITNLNSEVNGMWTEPELINVSSLPLMGGGSVSTTGYNVYRMRFTGIKTNEVVVEGMTQTWPGTLISVGFESTTNRDAHFYGGYVTSFTTDNGVIYNNVTMIRRVNAF